MNSRRTQDSQAAAACRPATCTVARDGEAAASDRLRHPESCVPIARTTPGQGAAYDGTEVRHVQDNSEASTGTFSDQSQ
jgi:hypothetical protein